MKTIYFITGNKGKFYEVKEKLKSLDITVIQENLGYPEVQGTSLKEVTKYGVDHIKKRLNLKNVNMISKRKMENLFVLNVEYGIMTHLQNIKKKSQVRTRLKRLKRIMIKNRFRNRPKKRKKKRKGFSV